MTDGILLVGHGTIQTLDEIPAFLLKIRRGRPPPEQLVHEMKERYAAIGGSPLLRISREQAAALEARAGVPVLVAMRFGEPPVESALEEAARRGLSRLCILPLAPFSVHVYAGVVRRAAEALGERSPALVEVAPWGLEPVFLERHAELLEQALEALPPREDAAVLLTAHSLPLRVLAMGDPYADQVSASARAIEERLGRPVSLCYQSQGAELGDWLGPDLQAALRQLAEHHRRVILSPMGFLADHVETLYDLDIEAAGWARELGLELVRLPALNTDPGLIEAMAAAAERACQAP